MKVGPVTKLDKENKTTSKKFYDDVMLVNCDVIVILIIYGRFRAIQKPNSGYLISRTYIFFKSNFLSNKN